jgi:hypothetical protein
MVHFSFVYCVKKKLAALVWKEKRIRFKEVYSQLYSIGLLTRGQPQPAGYCPEKIMEA